MRRHELDYRPQPSEATFAATDNQHNRKIPLAQSADNIIFGMEKFFEKTVLGVPRNRRDNEKVAEGSTIIRSLIYFQIPEGAQGFIVFENFNTENGTFNHIDFVGESGVMGSDYSSYVASSGNQSSMRFIRVN